MSSTTTTHDTIKIKDEELGDIVKIFKALSDRTRIKLISILATPKPHSVSEIAALLGMDISRVSHQLSKLENMGFIQGNRDGRNIYYEIKDECIRTLLQTAKDHISGK